MYSVSKYGGYTFVVPSMASPLNTVPKLCTSKSNKRPDIIDRCSKVYLGSYTEPTNYNPFFVPMYVENKCLIQLDITTDKEFCLVFYPTSTSFKNVLEKEYWSLVQPMFLCCDMGVYYLGLSSDNNIVRCVKSKEGSTYELTPQNITELSMGKPEESTDKVYVQKVGTYKI